MTWSIGPVLVGVALMMVLWPRAETRRFRVSSAPLVRGRALLVRRSRTSRPKTPSRDELVRRLPELVDMVALGVSAGLTGRDALFGSASRAAPEYREPIQRCRARVGAGEGLADSFDRLVVELGDVVRPLTAGILAAELDGVPLEPLLRRVADEARRKRRVQAETAARRLPVLMLFPLVLCVLPAFVLLSVVPVLADSIGNLELPG